MFHHTGGGKAGQELLLTKSARRNPAVRRDLEKKFKIDVPTTIRIQKQGHMSHRGRLRASKMLKTICGVRLSHQKDVLAEIEHQQPKRWFQTGEATGKNGKKLPYGRLVDLKECVTHQLEELSKHHMLEQNDMPTRISSTTGREERDVPLKFSGDGGR